jgi:hypothetical protein
MSTCIFSIFITLVFGVFVYRMIKAHNMAIDNDVKIRVKKTGVIVAGVYIFIITALINELMSK